MVLELLVKAYVGFTFGVYEQVLCQKFEAICMPCKCYRRISGYIKLRFTKWGLCQIIEIISKTQHLNYLLPSVKFIFFNDDLVNRREF